MLFMTLYFKHYILYIRIIIMISMIINLYYINAVCSIYNYTISMQTVVYNSPLYCLLLFFRCILLSNKYYYYFIIMIHDPILC